MSDDNQSQGSIIHTEEIQASDVPISDQSSQPKGSTPSDLPPEAPESPVSDIPTREISVPFITSYKEIL